MCDTNNNDTTSSSTANECADETPSGQRTFFDSMLFRWISLALYMGGIGGLGMVLAFYYLLFFDSTMPDIHTRFPISIDGRPVQKVQQLQPTQ